MKGAHTAVNQFQHSTSPIVFIFINQYYSIYGCRIRWGWGCPRELSMKLSSLPLENFAYPLSCPIRLLYFSVVQILCKIIILLRRILSFNRVDVEKTPPLKHGIPFLFHLFTMKRARDAEHLFQNSLKVSIFIFQCTHKKIHIPSNSSPSHFSLISTS